MAGAALDRDAPVVEGERVDLGRRLLLLEEDAEQAGLDGVEEAGEAHGQALRAASAATNARG